VEKKSVVISIIPARGGSKGVPKKNIKPLNGVPLIAYSIKASQRSRRIDRTVMSTDSEEIASIAREYGAEVPFLRPAALAGDRSTDYEFVAHALEWFARNEGKVPDYIVHLRPTTPLRNVATVDKAVEQFLASRDHTALRSAHEMPESAYKSFEIEDGLLKSVGTGSFELDGANRARQQFPKTYQANGYVDVLKTAYVLEHRQIHGNKVLGYVTPAVVEVDTMEEFELLEYQIGKDRRIYNELFG